MNTREILESETHKKLTRSDTDQGVILLVNKLNMYGGSNGSIQLYDLVARYLLEPKTREKINIFLKNI